MLQFSCISVKCHENRSLNFPAIPFQSFFWDTVYNAAVLPHATTPSALIIVVCESVPTTLSGYNSPSSLNTTRDKHSRFTGCRIPEPGGRTNMFFNALAPHYNDNNNYYYSSTTIIIRGHSFPQQNFSRFRRAVCQSLRLTEASFPQTVIKISMSA